MTKIVLAHQCALFYAFNPTSSLMSTSVTRRRSRTSLWLWTIQVLLAVVFLFTGGSKMAMSREVLAAQSHLPGSFMKFIGVCEILGALGLVLPGLLHVRPRLTPLAAACLTIIMIGATVSTALLMPVALPLPVIIGLLTAYVAYGRWRLAPLEDSSRLHDIEVAR
jgi:hypothetical protein